jgi:hypothetical protein
MIRALERFATYIEKISTESQSTFFRNVYFLQQAFSYYINALANATIGQSLGTAILMTIESGISDRLCGLVVRVPGYGTEMYCVSCEVLTEFICYVEESRAPLWSSGQSS